MDIVTMYGMAYGRRMHNGRELMTAPSTLTGQDIGEAAGAVRALLEEILARTATTSNEYIALRVLAVRGPFASPATLHEFLVSQRQLDLDPAGAAALLAGLEASALVSGASLPGPGPAQLTDAGRARYQELSEVIVPTTARLYSDIAPDDLSTTHRVLADVIDRAGRLRPSSCPSGKPRSVA
jgi:hypothetical protein